MNTTKRTQRPRQIGTPDLKRFLGDIAGRTQRLPRKLHKAFCAGQGGKVFRRMARIEYLARHKALVKLGAVPASPPDSVEVSA